MPRILIVDDDEAMRRVMSIMLGNAGHVVSIASNGREAAQMMKEIPFDLLITDILMPERDGIELLMELGKENRRIPVIAMTGIYDQSELYLKVSKNLGASRTLSKPFTESELLAMVAAVLGH